MLVNTPVSTVQARNNVTVRGSATGRPVVFAHGFGCDQSKYGSLHGYADEVLEILEELALRDVISWGTR